MSSRLLEASLEIKKKETIPSLQSKPKGSTLCFTCFAIPYSSCPRLIKLLQPNMTAILQRINNLLDLFPQLVESTKDGYPSHLHLPLLFIKLQKIGTKLIWNKRCQPCSFCHMTGGLKALNFQWYYTVLYRKCPYD